MRLIPVFFRYIHDGELTPEAEAKGRIDGQPQDAKCRLKPETVQKLQEMLKDTNRLVKTLNFVSKFDDQMAEGKKFVLKAEGRPADSHQGVYNLPVADEIALVALNDSLKPADIQIYPKKGPIQRISQLHKVNMLKSILF